MNLSFNASAYRAPGGRDFIEVAPRAATLHFRPQEIDGWSWSEALSVLISETMDSVTLKLGALQSDNTARGGTLRTEISGEGGVKIPFVVATKAAVRAGAEAMRSNTRGNTASSEVTRVRRERWIEMMRPDLKTFELRLNSPPADDLVRLNPDLNRLSVLFAPEPGSLDPRDVTVAMSAQIKVDGHKVAHALRIRDAGGAWARLIETRNKQVIAEILVSKFLEPLHAPKKIWPPKGSADRG